MTCHIHRTSTPFMATSPGATINQMLTSIRNALLAKEGRTKIKKKSADKLDAPPRDRPLTMATWHVTHWGPLIDDLDV